MITPFRFIIGIGIFIYIAGFFITLNKRTTEYIVDDDFEVHTKTNEATASDVWFSIFWFVSSLFK